MLIMFLFVPGGFFLLLLFNLFILFFGFF